MDAARLLSDLSGQGFALSIDGERLIVSPSSRLSETVRAEIRAHKPALLALLAANDPAANAPEVAPQFADTDRRTCRQCRNLALNGRCLAAGRGELPLTSSQFEPFVDRLERCVGYLPTKDDPDQRPGSERYPGLYMRLWAMDGRTGR